MYNVKLDTLLPKLGITPLSYKELKLDRVYLVNTETKQVIVKFTPLQWAVDEVFFLQECQRHSIAHPELLEYGTYNIELGYLVLEYVQDAIDGLNEELRTDEIFWSAYASELKKIHSIPVQGFGFNQSNTFGIQNFTAPTFKAAINILLNELIEDLTGSEYEQSILELHKQQTNLRDYTQAYLAHGDIADGNFLWNPKKQRLYFFDPGYFRGMPETWDIAYFGWRVAPNRVTNNDIEKITTIYFDGTPDAYTTFEINFLRTFIGLMKINDGRKAQSINDSHVKAMLQNLQSTINSANSLN